MSEDVVKLCEPIREKEYYDYTLLSELLLMFPKNLFEDDNETDDDKEMHSHEERKCTHIFERACLQMNSYEPEDSYSGVMFKLNGNNTFLQLLWVSLHNTVLVSSALSYLNTSVAS